MEGENISIEGVSLKFNPEELPEILKGALPYMKMIKDSVSDHNGRELEKLCSDYNEQGKQLSEARAENSELKAEINKLKFEVSQLTAKLEFEEKKLKHRDEEIKNLKKKNEDRENIGHVTLESLDSDAGDSFHGLLDD